MGWTSCDVKIVTTLHPLQMFTNNDTIQGKVHLVLEKDVDIKAVSVGLICKEFVHILVSTGQSAVVYTGKEDYYEHVLKLFPPRDVPDAPSYTLPKGEHVFDFDLRFPESPQLPQSFFYDSDNQVSWHLVALVERASMLKMNSRSRLPLTFYPYRPLADCAGTVRVDIDTDIWTVKAHNEGYESSFKNVFTNKNRQNVDISYTISTYREGILQRPFDSGVNVTLRPNQSGFLRITSIKLSLHCRNTIQIKRHRVQKKVKYTLLEWETELEPDSKYGISLSQVLTDASLPQARLKEVIPGTFNTQYITRMCSLELEVTFQSTNNPRYTKKRSTSVPVVLTMPSVESIERNDAPQPVGNKSIERNAPQPVGDKSMSMDPAQEFKSDKTL